jgi:hypothetical protein
MKRVEVDKLKVGDVIKYRTYSLWDEDYKVVDAKVINVYECTSGGKHSVRIEYHLDGGTYRDILDNELVVEQGGLYGYC